MQLLALIPLLLLLLQPVSVLATTPDNDHLEKLNPSASVLATTPNNDNMEKLKPPVSTLANTPDNDHLEKLNPPVSGLATTPDNDHMERLKPGGVRRDDTGPVRISLYDQGEDEDGEPNLTCDEGERGEKAVTCRLLPFGDCCQGGDNELFDSSRYDQVDGWTSFGIYSGNSGDPCGVLLKSNKDWDITCLAGGDQGMTIFGASVEGDDGGGGDGGGNDASIQDNGGASKPKKRAVRADWYTFQYRGMMYHIKMNSSLGETYRNLATKAEQREFAMEHGEPEPVVGRRVRPGAAR